MTTEKDINFFLDNIEKFREQHTGHYVLIKDGKLCAVYIDVKAVEANARKHGKPLIFYIGEDGYEEYTLIDS